MSAAFVRLIAVAAVCVLLLVAIAFLTKYAPEAMVAIAMAVGVVILIAMVLTIVVSLFVAVEVEPPRPVAETSILGKHAVGLSKMSIALLAFFGNTALTWIVALSVSDRSSVALDLRIAGIQDSLWPLFGFILTFAACFFWMWVAVDLSRTPRDRRKQAADTITERWVNRLGLPPDFSWRIQSIGRWVVGGPWWQTVLSFYFSPFFVILAVATYFGQL